MTEDGSKFDNWEIERVYREQDKIGCLVIALVMVLIIGSAIGLAVKSWVFN